MSRRESYEVVAEIEVTNQRLAPNPIEPLVILAVPEDEGRLTVYVSHQRPHGVKARLCQLLPYDPDKLRVVVPDVGGAFGMKGMTYPEHTVTAAMALRLERPVIWVERRREHLSGGTHGRGSVHKVRLLGTSAGRVQRAEIDVLADVGAYPHNGATIPVFSRLVAFGLYDIESAASENHRRGHQYGSHGLVSRRGASRSRLCHREGDRRLRPCRRSRPGRGPPDQLHTVRIAPLPHRHRRPL